MQGPLVSVVIPTYNRANLVGRAIASVLRQSYPHVEVIVVDDGSTDNTRATIQANFHQPNLRYLYQANGGVSRARNTGIQHAGGKYVGFLDSDDWWHEDKLRYQVDCMEANPGCACVLCETYTISNGRTVQQSSHSQYFDDTGDNFRALIQHLPSISGPGSTTLARAEHLALAGGFDETLATSEDRDLVLRLSEKGKAFSVNRPLVYVEKQGDSISHTAVTRNTIRVLDKIREYAPAFYAENRKVIERSKYQKLLQYAKDALWAKNYSEAGSLLREATEWGWGIEVLVLRSKIALYRMLKR